MRILIDLRNACFYEKKSVIFFQYIYRENFLCHK